MFGTARILVKESQRDLSWTLHEAQSWLSHLSRGNSSMEFRPWGNCGKTRLRWLPIPEFFVF